MAWFVDVLEKNGRWRTLDNTYDVPPPRSGGRPEQVLRMEILAAEKAGISYGKNNTPLYAYWRDPTTNAIGPYAQWDPGDPMPE